MLTCSLFVTFLTTSFFISPIITSNLYSRCEESILSSLLGLSMAQEEDEHSLEAKFDAAVKVIRSLPEDGEYCAAYGKEWKW